MGKNIKKKIQNKPVYMTISEANAHNIMTPNNAFMIGIGTEDSPEFIYPEELNPAIVTSSKKESDYKQAEKEASTFRNRSLAGHIGTGLGLDLGDKSLQNIAATAIGVPLVATNPVTTTLIKPLIKGIGHTGKVLLDPTKALTGAGQAAATTADIYGTIQGLRQIPGAINNIKQGNGTGMDYFNLATGIMGPFGTFNAIKAARFNPYLRQVAGYKNLGLEDGDRLSHIEQSTNNVRGPMDDPAVQRMFRTQELRTQQILNEAQQTEEDLLNLASQVSEQEITPFEPNINFDIDFDDEGIPIISGRHEPIRPNINFGNNGTQNSIRQLNSQIVPNDIQNEIDEIFQTANRNHPYSSYSARREFIEKLRDKGLITQYLQKEVGKPINDIIGNYFYNGEKFISKSEVIDELKALGHSDHSINEILNYETKSLTDFINGNGITYDIPKIRIAKPRFEQATHAKRIELAHLEDSEVIKHLFEDNGALKQAYGAGSNKGLYAISDYNFTDEDIELLEQLVNNYNKSTNNNISVTDILNDTDIMADLRNYLRNNYAPFGVKGENFPGDINHMAWFQGGTVDGYGPVNTYKKVAQQVSKDASDLISSIPRGYAIGEQNTSFDSEMLKLLYSLKSKNYGRNKDQISIEFNKDNHGIVVGRGNSMHKERVFAKDLYDKYKDKLSDSDKEVLEEIINRGRTTTSDEITELMKKISPELKSIIELEFNNLGKTLSTKMQNVWDRLIQKDPTLKDAPKIYPDEFDEYKLRHFIMFGNTTPHIHRPSIRIQKNKYGGTNKFKFGGMKQNKVFKLNGGMALPLDDKKRLFYLSGAKHEQGGIDVTPELEAEGGEVIKINPKSIKVVTAQKIMGGKSPAELVVDASSTGKSDKVFNKVFKYQEDFKDRYNLNDDGTKKAELGKEQSIKNNTKGTYIDKLIANYITNNVNKLGKQEFIKRLHDNLIPFGYGKGIIDTIKRIYNAINKNKQETEVEGQLPGKWNRKMLEDSGVMDIYGEYLGMPKEDRYFSNSHVENSKYKPTTSTDEDIVYKTLYPLPEKLRNNIINEGMKLKLGDIKESPIQDEAFNTYTISRGKDDKGEYISFYDKWDLNPTRGTEGNKLLRMFSSGDDQFVNLGIAKPLEFYDRIYLNDIDKKQLGGEMKNKKKAQLGLEEQYNIDDSFNSYTDGNYNINATNINDSEKYIDTARNTLNHVSSLYNTKRAQRSINRLNDYAIKHGMLNTKYDAINNNRAKKFGLQLMDNINLVDEGNSYFGGKGTSQINITSDHNNTFASKIAHEAAHGRNLFNVDSLGYKGGETKSNYYGFTHDYIHPRAKRLLRGEYATTRHDMDLSERYANLMGLREKLNEQGINDGLTRKYRRSDLRKLKGIYNDNFFIGNRNIGRTKRALNNVYKLGGKQKANLGTKNNSISVIKTPSTMITSAQIQNPTQFTPKKWEDTNKIDLNSYTGKERLLNTGDWINIGSNALGAVGNLLTGLLTPNIKYARMKDPIPIMAPKINSNVNTTAEENAADEAYNDEIRAINENTANSKTALNRKRNATLRKRNAKVAIRANAENISRNLKNKDNKLKAEYQKYNVARQEQVDAYNRQAEAAEFNANRTKTSDAITGFLSDLTGGASTIINAIEERQKDKLDTANIYAAYPNINPTEFNKGRDEIYEGMFGKRRKTNLRTRKSNKK